MTDFETIRDALQRCRPFAPGKCADALAALARVEAERKPGQEQQGRDTTADAVVSSAGSSTGDNSAAPSVLSEPDASQGVDPAGPSPEGISVSVDGAGASHDDGVGRIRATDKTHPRLGQTSGIAMEAEGQSHGSLNADSTTEDAPQGVLPSPETQERSAAEHAALKLAAKPGGEAYSLLLEEMRLFKSKLMAAEGALLAAEQAEAETRRQHEVVMAGIKRVGGIGDGHSGVYTEQDGSIREWNYRLARVVECPFCAFIMGAEHLDDKPGDPSYTCPVCNDSAAEASLKEAREYLFGRPCPTCGLDPLRSSADCAECDARRALAVVVSEGRARAWRRALMHSPVAQVNPPERCPDCDDWEINCMCGEMSDELDCTHCGGDGECMDNSDPLWDCDDLPHACHACGGTGRHEDQRIF